MTAHCNILSRHYSVADTGVRVWKASTSLPGATEILAVLQGARLKQIIRPQQNATYASYGCISVNSTATRDLVPRSNLLSVVRELGGVLKLSMTVLACAARACAQPSIPRGDCPLTYFLASFVAVIVGYLSPKQCLSYNLRHTGHHLQPPPCLFSQFSSGFEKQDLKGSNRPIMSKQTAMTSFFTAKKARVDGDLSSSKRLLESAKKGKQDELQQTREKKRPAWSETRRTELQETHKIPTSESFAPALKKAKQEEVLAAGQHTHDREPAYSVLMTKETTLVPPRFVNDLSEVQRQWWRVKATHADCVLFFKIGRFYELYHYDADVGVREAGLVYMKGEQAHAGFPEQAYGKYCAALVRKGFKVARVEQTETPEDNKERLADARRRGIKLDKAAKAMRREVCSVTTPGTRLATHLDEDEAGGALVAACGGAACTLEARTATFTLWPHVDLAAVVAETRPAELLLEEDHAVARGMLAVETRPFEWTNERTLTELESLFPRSNWSRELEEALSHEPCVRALGAVLALLRRCLVDVELANLGRFRVNQQAEAGSAIVELSGTTLEHLEILKTADGKTGSLWSLVNHARTGMGARKLRDWVCRPLSLKCELVARQDAVAELVAAPEQLERIMERLKQVPDVETLVQQSCMLGSKRRGIDGDHPDSRAVLFDAIKLQGKKLDKLCSAVKGLAALNCIFQDDDWGRAGLLRQCRVDFPATLETELQPFENVVSRSDSTAGDDAYDAAMSTVAQLEGELDLWLSEARKKYKLGSCSTFASNGKDKYCIKVPEERAARLALPEGWVQRAKSKKFRTFAAPHAMSLAARLEVARKKCENAKADQLRSLFAAFADKAPTWYRASVCAATLDALCSLALVSRRPGFCRPEIVDGDALEMRQVSHPCLEDDVVANDLDIKNGVLLLSGPNMGGKSTMLRTVGLTAVLAQIGCYVKATSVRLAPLDHVFTRLGANDHILAGVSTLMLELTETAHMLKHATPKSLCLLDELGRGTATFDGAAIAHAVIHHLVFQNRTKVLFATHYHDLVKAWAGSAQLKHMACLIEDETLVFLYKLEGGAADHSFGVDVAKLAKLPGAVLARASSLASNFKHTNQCAL